MKHWLIIGFLFLAGNCFAQTPVCGLNNNQNPYIPGTTPSGGSSNYDTFTPPAVGSSYVDALTGCTVTRITNMVADSVTGYTIYYASLSAISAGGKYIVLNNGSVNMIKAGVNLTGVTPGTTIIANVNNQTYENIRWDLTNPKVFYYTPGNTTIHQVTLTGTCTNTGNCSLTDIVLHDYSGGSPIFAGVWIPDAPDMGQDGQTIPFIAQTTLNSHMIISTYNVVTNSTVQWYTTTCTGNQNYTQPGCIHKLQMTPANEPLVGFSSNGTSGETGEVWIHGTPGSATLTHVMNTSGHLDGGYDINGTEIMVEEGLQGGFATDPCPGSQWTGSASGGGNTFVYYTDPTNAGSTAICYQNINYAGAHVSYKGGPLQPWIAEAFADSRNPGPEWFSNDANYHAPTTTQVNTTTSGVGWYPYEGEIDLVKVTTNMNSAGTGPLATVYRIAQTRSRSNENYWDQVFGSLSRDGNYIAFNSNMANINGCTGSANTGCSDVYIISGAAGAPLFGNPSPPVPAASFPPTDIYGGLIQAPSPAGGNGYFRRERMNSGYGKWAFVDPLGNYFDAHCMYALTYADGGTNYGNAVATKYASHVQWANFQLARMQQYGFNCIGAYSSTGNYNVYPLESYNIAAASIQMPFLYDLNGSDYCTRGTSAADPIYPYSVGNLYNQTNPAVYNAGGRKLVDYYDPAFATCIGDIVNATGDLTDGWGGGFNGGISTSSPWLLGFWIDDTDNMYGTHGFGPGWAGFISIINNPFKNACANCDRNVYSKTSAAAALQAEYTTIGALNTAWGSTYSTFGSTTFSWSGANEDTALVTGNGSTSSYAAINMTHPGITGTITINIQASPYSQLFSDNCTRANENPLSDSGAWTLVPGFANLQLSSNQCEGTTVATNAEMYVNSISPGANEYCSVTVTTLTGSAGCFMRESGTSGNITEYVCFANNGFSNTTFTLAKFVGGTYTQLIQGTGINFTSGQAELCQLNGTTFSVYANGVFVTSTTDSSISSAGHIGAIIYPSAAASDTQISLFAAGNYSSASDQKAGQDNGSGGLVGTGCVASQCVTGGTINYTNGEISSLTFSGNIPNNATVNMSYTGNAWPKMTTAGTGLLDEDGSSSWFPTTPYPTGGNATLITDMDALEFKFYDKYFLTEKTQIHATYPNHMIFGPGDFVYNTSPYIFAAQAKEIDVSEVNFGGINSNSSAVSDTASCDAATAQGYTCIPQMDYLGIAAYPDSAMTAGWGGPNNEASCNITGGTTNLDYTLQTLRGTCYQQAARRIFNAKTSGGIKTGVGFTWWEWVDNTINGQNNNFGIVSSLDNPYGLGLDTSGPACNETQGSVTIQDCNEASTRGDFLDPVINANTWLFNSLITAAGVGPVKQGLLVARVALGNYMHALSYPAAGSPAAPSKTALFLTKRN